MRFTIDLEHGPDGHVGGVVVGPEGGEPVGFDGWLQLLRMLAATALPAPALPAEDPTTDPFTVT